MTVNRAELALTAARTRRLAEQLGDTARDALIAEWADMLEELEEPRVNSSLVLADYRASVEERLAVRELHRPLEEVR